MSAFKFSPIEKKSASVKVTHASANAWCLEYCLFQTSRTVCVAPPASGAGRFQSVGGRKIGGSAGVGKIAATGRTAGKPRGWRAEGSVAGAPRTAGLPSVAGVAGVRVLCGSLRHSASVITRERAP
jgi:hypothetical protein